MTNPDEEFEDVLRQEQDEQAAIDAIMQDESYNLEVLATLATLADMQRHGKKIGLVNGCYDLLHPGHVFFLRQAANYCDHLVVGLNNDESVRALNKGPGQPYWDYGLRLLMFEELTPVGSVLDFDGDVEALIAAVSPDVIIRGFGQHLSETEKAMEARDDGSLIWVTARVWSTSQTVDAILKAHGCASSSYLARAAGDEGSEGG